MARLFTVLIVAIPALSCATPDSPVEPVGDRPHLNPAPMAPNEVFELRLVAFGSSDSQHNGFECWLAAAWDSLPANGVSGRELRAHAGVSARDPSGMSRVEQELHGLRLTISYFGRDSARIDLTGPVTVSVTTRITVFGSYHGDWSCPAGFPGSEDPSIVKRGFRTWHANDGFFSVAPVPPPPSAPPASR